MPTSPARSARRRAAGRSPRSPRRWACTSPPIPRSTTSSCRRTPAVHEPHRQAHLLPAGLLRAGARASWCCARVSCSWSRGATGRSRPSRGARRATRSRRGGDRSTIVAGVQLAVTQEFYHVGIAPNEVVDRRALVQAASRALGVGAGELQRKLRAGKYMYFYGPYTATADRAAATAEGRASRGQFPAGLSVVARGAGHRTAPARQQPGRFRARARARRPAHGHAGRGGVPARPGRDAGSSRRRGRSATRCRATTCGSRSMPSCRTSPSASSRMRSGSWAPGAATSWCSTRGPGELLAVASRQAGVDRGRIEPDRVHQSVRAGLDGEALHRRGAAPARQGGQHRPGERRGWPLHDAALARSVADDQRRAQDRGADDAGRRHQDVEQHRHGEVLPAPQHRRSSSRRCATSGSAARPASSSRRSRGASSRRPSA